METCEKPSIPHSTYTIYSLQKECHDHFSSFGYALIKEFGFHEKGELSQFSVKHLHLKEKLNHRLKEVTDKVIQHDMTVLLDRMDQLEHGFTAVESWFKKLTIVEAEAHLKQWNHAKTYQKEGHTMMELQKWCHQDIKKVVYVILGALHEDCCKVKESLHSVCHVVHAIEDRLHDTAICRAMKKEQKDDLVILGQKAKFLMVMLIRMKNNLEKKKAEEVLKEKNETVEEPDKFLKKKHVKEDKKHPKKGSDSDSEEPVKKKHTLNELEEDEDLFGSLYEGRRSMMRSRNKHHLKRKRISSKKMSNW